MIGSLENKTTVSSQVLSKLSRYLKKRSQENHNVGLSVLFDLTYACNLECVGCGVNASFVKNKHTPLSEELSTSEITNILEKLACQLSGTLHPRICFGGGEPLLRPDLPQVLESASKLFGRASLCIDTNGYLLSPKMLDCLGQYVSKIEFGCEGVPSRHNSWRNPYNRTLPESPYSRLVNAVKRSLSWKNSPLTVELLFLPTRENSVDFPDTIRRWAKLGVKHFSVHRCMPTGRMASYPWLIPEWSDYLQIFEHALLLQEELGVHIHMHHSIENALSKILLGNNIPNTYETLCPNWRATVTIDSHGYVHFCPWAVNGCLSQFHLGHALEYDFQSLFVNHRKFQMESNMNTVYGCAIPSLLDAEEVCFTKQNIIHASTSDPILQSVVHFSKEKTNGDG